ncbi:MAG: squalene synthase HpnC [Planctomycetaceae bacterium]|nr:MAG: squalene synthase HpnC [Planctomycetaceae bacterium]
MSRTKWDFQREWATWGPQGVKRGEVPTYRQAVQYCTWMAQTHYENFPVLSQWLPEPLREPLSILYAFCRWSDDLGDELKGTVSGATAAGLVQEYRQQALAWWRSEFRACVEGSARHPVMVALKSLIERYALDPTLFTDLISAFEQDQQKCEYATYAELLDYCRRSANPVGRLVLQVMGEANESSCRWSDAICSGLQLANFWQDVGRDYDQGRVYLPREDYERFGLCRADFAQRQTTPAFRALLAWEVARTRKLLEEGWPLAHQLGGRVGLVVELFLRGGLTILDKIERINYRVWEYRPVVTRWDCMTMLWRAGIHRLMRRSLPVVAPR